MDGTDNIKLASPDQELGSTNVVCPSCNRGDPGSSSFWRFSYMYIWNVKTLTENLVIIRIEVSGGPVVRVCAYQLTIGILCETSDLF